MLRFLPQPVRALGRDAFRTPPIRSVSVLQKEHGCVVILGPTASKRRLRPASVSLFSSRQVAREYDRVSRFRTGNRGLVCQSIRIGTYLMCVVTPVSELSSLSMFECSCR